MIDAADEDADEDTVVKDADSTLITTGSAIDSGSSVKRLAASDSEFVEFLVEGLVKKHLDSLRDVKLSESKQEDLISFKEDVASEPSATAC
ncbi:unnamed protein product [[Candida] boidinii]|nr:unnamed protein product [[Candida] boidinii]